MSTAPGSVPTTVAWADDGAAVRIIDQRELPGALVHRDLRTLDDVLDAITTLAVRGAPAIGVAGAMGLSGVMRGEVLGREGTAARHVAAAFEAAARAIERARPTAVNLAWAIARMRAVAAPLMGEPTRLLAALAHEAEQIRADDVARCERIGVHGLTLLRDGMRLLTHCNAGALATAGIGTALAPIYLAAARGWRLHVHADETRPLLQGARLTMWELTRAGIPCTLLTDSMAASLLRDGGIDAVLVGADRIAANGDVVNKIGTYPLALAAHAHAVPFYVLAPESTVDAATARGADVVIEARAHAEVTHVAGRAVAPGGAAAHNPAFDWTPAALVNAIITDAGVHRPPFDFGAHRAPT